MPAKSFLKVLGTSYIGLAISATKDIYILHFAKLTYFPKRKSGINT